MIFRKLFFFLSLLSVAAYGQDSVYIERMLDTAEILENGQQQAAIAAYRKIATASRTAGYTRGLAKTFHYRGFVYADMGQYDSSLQCFAEAVPLYSKIGDVWSVCACYNSTGNTYQYMTMYDSAIVNYQRALDLFDLHDMQPQKRNIYIGKGRVHSSMMDYQLALKDYEEAEKLSLAAGDSTTLAQALVNQGAVYHELKKPAENFIRQLRALEIARLRKDDYLIEIATVNLSDHYSRIAMHDSAQYYANIALDKARLLNNQFEIVKILCIVSSIKLAMGNPAEAKQLLEDALVIAEKIGSAESRVDVYHKMQLHYAKTGDYPNAYRYLLRYREASDSILSDKHIRTIHEMEVRHQSARKDAALAEGKLRIEQKNNQLIGISAIGGIVLIALIAAVWISRQRQRLQQERFRTQEEKNEVKLLEAAMAGEERERSRIAGDLHDGIAGMLAAIKMHLSMVYQAVPGLPESEGLGNALHLLDEASHEVRKTAHNLMPEMIEQYGLGESMRRYCGNLGRYGNIRIDCHVLGNISRCRHNFELAVYRLAQELIHNAIRHADASQIMVQLTQVEMVLNITVEDDGKGFDTTQAGMGLTALRNRVKTLGGIIEWDSSPGKGTSAYVEFDITPFAREHSPGGSDNN
ncbi:tetratricopeptide repeat-containing sensor histidine kinase [Chitinophaga deserti]|uniref:tetratricopeptide repeat-containing sensor histidine kinase n=1 Tax=Chitinophaga deserti TaxID=2164099 RepID=UPI000D6DB4C8|nr:sensor histidine kinase [Chitinophaga deserti]